MEQLCRKRRSSTSLSTATSTRPAGASCSMAWAYRVHCSIEKIGRYRADSKRRVTWRFGFTNLHAAKEGKQAADCRGEEHEVILVWSVKSGKTRVFWNKANITHFFRDQLNIGQVTLSWEARSGVKFAISAHETPTRSGPQYDFLLDGMSIFSLSHLSELESVQAPDRILSDIAEVRSEATPDTRSDGGCSMDCDAVPDNSDAGFRLSMAGLKPSSEFIPSLQAQDDIVDDLMDDLASASFTNVMESLRRRITSIIPNSNDMVSRAIVKALSEDVYESSSCSSSLGSSSLDSVALAQSATEIVAEAICATVEWVNLNVQYAPRPDVAEQKREFLQRQMDSMFMHAHNERLTEDAAARVLSDVATLLGIPLRTVIPKDTLILKDLDRSTDCEVLLGSLMVYGEIYEIGMIASQHFAICRFSSERGPLRAISAYEQGLLMINRRRPQIQLIEKPCLERPGLANRAMSAPVISNVPIPKPNLGRRKSHQRNTIQIDTLINETSFLRLMNDDPAVVSPVESASFVKPTVLDKIVDPSLHQIPDMRNPGPSSISPTSASPTMSCNHFDRI